MVNYLCTRSWCELTISASVMLYSFSNFALAIIGSSPFPRAIESNFTIHS